MTQSAPLPKTRLKSVNCIIKLKVISDGRFFQGHRTSLCAFSIPLTIILSLPWFYVVIFTTINGRPAKSQVEMRTSNAANVLAINEGSS